MKAFENFLIEKQILFNQGKKYGQIVFMAGGAGSGKGFAQKIYMEISQKIFPGKFLLPKNCMYLPGPGKHPP